MSCTAQQNRYILIKKCNIEPSPGKNKDCYTLDTKVYYVSIFIQLYNSFCSSYM